MDCLPYFPLFSTRAWRPEGPPQGRRYPTQRAAYEGATGGQDLTGPAGIQGQAIHTSELVDVRRVQDTPSK